MVKQVLTVQQQDGETVAGFHERLMRMYKCHGCPEYGNNGCGSWRLAGYEFSADLDGCEYVEEMEYPQDWQCWNPQRSYVPTHIMPTKNNDTRATDLTLLQSALMEAYVSQGVSPDVAARCTSYSLWQYMGTNGTPEA